MSGQSVVPRGVGARRCMPQAEPEAKLAGIVAYREYSGRGGSRVTELPLVPGAG